MGRTCRTHAGKTYECTTVVGKPQDRRPPFRNWLRLDGRVETDLQERV